MSDYKHTVPEDTRVYRKRQRKWRNTENWTWDWANVEHENKYHNDCDWSTRNFI